MWVVAALQHLGRREMGGLWGGLYKLFAETLHWDLGGNGRLGREAV